MLPINPLNCFLAGVICVFTLCKTFLNGVFPNVFQAGTSVFILDVLSLNNYLGVKNSLRKYGLIFKLDSRGPIPTWFVSVINFVKNSGLDIDVTAVSCSAPTKFSHDVGFTSECLLAFGHSSVKVYTDGFVKSLKSISAYGGAAAYFPKASVSIAITLALKCVLAFSMVELFTDSQALLNIFKFNIDMFGPDFCCKYWIKKEHIHQKIKRHSDIIENKRTDFFANTVVFFGSILLLDTSGVAPVLLRLVLLVNSVHPSHSVFNTLMIESAPIIPKKLYNPRYSSMMCIRCDMVEDSDYLFLCMHNDNIRKTILLSIRKKWCKVAGGSALGGKMTQSLCEAESSTVNITYSLGIRLSIHMSFDLCPHLTGLGFKLEVVFFPFVPFIISSNVSLFVPMDLVGSSAGASSSSSAGLGSWSGSKKIKARIKSVYSRGPSYKKTKLPGVFGGIMDLLDSLLSVGMLYSNGVRLQRSWRSEVDSKEAGVSKVSDAENLESTVAKKTSYMDPNVSKTDEIEDDTTPKKT
ncbi:hypothetical protein G9A89_017180 [Geosiphon pyriformis]|nr:hypothetical protein G9A89_017180 [Geosiphon pyriformis]